MWVAIIAQFVMAKFGAEWGGIFNTFVPYIIPTLAAATYYWWNYAQKKTSDGFAPESWLSGKRTMIGLILTIIAPFISQWSTGTQDAVTQTITLIADVATPALFMLFQAKSDIKLAAPATVTQTAATATTYTAPVVTLPEATVATAIVNQSGNMKTDLKAASATIGSWEGAKSFMLGTFKDRFEAALKRYAALSMSTIEAVRKAVQDVTGVCLDEKTCQALGQQPGFLGAMSSGVDITIIGDLFAAIDKTPELVYMKAPFIKIAVRYARKAILDGVVKNVQSGITETVKTALLYAGMSLYQAEKTIPELPGYMWYSTMPDVLGTYSFRPFDITVLAGVDPDTLEDR
jgi:hypothetical protein